MARHAQHKVKEWLNNHWPLIVGLTLLLIFIIGGVALGNALSSHPTSPPRPAVSSSAPSFVGPTQPPPIVQPPTVQPPAKVMTYEIKPGDTLWGIAQAHCGNPLKWPRLWHANMRLIVNPNLIFPRQVIQLVC